ncbi:MULTISPECIES: hypothetical protein [unclassified Bradyrhizobium]|uniref:hypothetical protein n=1 Tax=unclassified Bradyrhizobium TaxID=2631580 RepID=UPI001FFAD345|nr:MULTISPECIES: hypothetical protein [unclassified Bradyrhizobium]
MDNVTLSSVKAHKDPARASREHIMGCITRNLLQNVCGEGLLKATDEHMDSFAFGNRLLHPIEFDHGTTSRNLHNRPRQSNAIAMNRKRPNDPFTTDCTRFNRPALFQVGQKRYKRCMRKVNPVHPTMPVEQDITARELGFLRFEKLNLGWRHGGKHSILSQLPYHRKSILGKRISVLAFAAERSDGKYLGRSACTSFEQRAHPCKYILWTTP